MTGSRIQGGGGAALQRPAGSTDPQRPKPPHRRLTTHTTGTGIGAPRPHAVNGTFPRALCFWVVAAEQVWQLGTGFDLYRPCPPSLALCGLRFCPWGALLWITSLQTIQWVLSLSVGGTLRRAGYWGPLATQRRVPGVLLPVEALLSLMDLTQHGCISLPVPIFRGGLNSGGLTTTARPRSLCRTP